MPVKLGAKLTEGLGAGAHLHSTLEKVRGRSRRRRITLRSLASMARQPFCAA